MQSLRRQLVAVKRKLAVLEHKRLYGVLTRPEIVQARSLAGQKRSIERQLEQGRPGNTIKPRREWQQRKGVRNHQVPGGLPTLGR